MPELREHPPQRCQILTSISLSIVFGMPATATFRPLRLHSCRWRASSIKVWRESTITILSLEVYYFGETQLRWYENYHIKLEPYYMQSVHFLNIKIWSTAVYRVCTDLMDSVSSFLSAITSNNVDLKLNQRLIVNFWCSKCESLTLDTRLESFHHL